MSGGIQAFQGAAPILDCDWPECMGRGTAFTAAGILCETCSKAFLKVSDRDQLDKLCEMIGHIDDLQAACTKLGLPCELEEFRSEIMLAMKAQVDG